MARLAGTALLGAVLSLPLGGCALHATPALYGYDAYYADAPYGDVYYSPRVYWHGGYAYWYGDRWWYRNGGRWMVLRQEPPELYGYRSRYYYQGRPRGTYVAPPAYRGGGPVYRPPNRSYERRR